MQPKSLRYLHLLLPLVVFAMVSGCASANNQMATWKGHPQAELIQKWGPPTRTASDGAAGSILIYEYANLGQPAPEGYVGREGFVIPDGAIWYPAPQGAGYVARRIFWVNASGQIYDWRSQGL